MTLVYCGPTVGWIRMRIVTEVGLGPGHTVLDGDPALPHRKGHSSRPYVSAPLWPNGRPSQLSSCLAINSATENVNVARINALRSLDCRQAFVNCCQRRFMNCTSHNRALRDCGSTVNTTVYPKGYAQSKCVSYIVTMRW